MDKYLFELDNIKNNLVDTFENTQKIHFYTDLDNAANKILSNQSKQ